jgi:hypothetical protein
LDTAYFSTVHATVRHRIGIARWRLASAELHKHTLRIGFTTGKYTIVVGSGDQHVFVPGLTQGPKFSGLDSEHTHCWL